MMACKAELFKDYFTRDKILKNNNPKEIKALGRKVIGFNQNIWDFYKYNIVLFGNILKFSQNTELKNFLLNTGSDILIEASPYDSIWGIGLCANSTDALDPKKWKGSNLLGFALMETRDFLIKGVI